MDVITRLTAGRQGLRHYFTGKPCKRGHVAQRAIANGECMACHAEREMAWRAANPGVQSARQTAYLARTPDAADRAGKGHPRKIADPLGWFEAKIERNADSAKAWQKANRPRTRVTEAAWRKAHPEVVRLRRKAAKANRRAKEVAAIGSHSARDILALYRLQGGRCAGCRKKTKLHLDHIIPLARGGSNNKENLQLLCPPCNIDKSARDPFEWAQSHGRLL